MGEREAELEAHASHVLPTKESLQLTKLRARSPYLTYVYNTTNPRRAAPVGKNLEPGTQTIQFEERKKRKMSTALKLTCRTRGRTTTSRVCTKAVLTPPSGKADKKSPNQFRTKKASALAFLSQNED